MSSEAGLEEIAEAQEWAKRKRYVLKALRNEVEKAPHSGHCKGYVAGCICWKLRAERLIYGLGGARIKRS